LGHFSLQNQTLRKFNILVVCVDRGCFKTIVYHSQKPKSKGYNFILVFI
jgi:hypothetical protein